MRWVKDIPMILLLVVLYLLLLGPKWALGPGCPGCRSRLKTDKAWPGKDSWVCNRCGHTWGEE